MISLWNKEESLCPVQPIACGRSDCYEEHYGKARQKEAEDDKDSTDGKSDGESESKEESHEAETGGDE